MTTSQLDDNAEVLARMSEQGDDLTQTRVVEFAHVFGEARSAEAFRAWAEAQGYVAAVEAHDDAKLDVIVGHAMIPDLQLLTDLEVALAETARGFGGEPDGWGCFSVPN